MLLGVDVGGTFTDAVLAAGGRLYTAKAPTTPDDQSEGVLAAVRSALERAGADAGEVAGFAHGTTAATDALLEGLDVDDALRRIADLEPEAVAVCLLHAYRHPQHEQALGEALAKRMGDVHVSLSHEVVGTFREFERAATTELDAALSPLLDAYLKNLASSGRDAGLPAPAVMQSSGGLAALEHAAGHAALTVLSGPAGGAAGAAWVSRAADEPNVLCFDMGGTSCDVCVVLDGAVREASGREVGGRPVALPMLDIHTVGAGGGSIGWRDAGGAPRARPRSAGARPRPACYGLGGE